MNFFPIDLLAARRNGRLDKNGLEQLQTKRLRKLLVHAYQNVRMYKKIFKALGITPDDIKGPQDLMKLPVVSKKDFQNESEYLSKNIKKDKLKLSQTSGSSGTPFHFYYNKDDKAKIFGIYHRQLFENGLAFTDSWARINRPYNFGPKPVLPNPFFRKYNFSDMGDFRKTAALLNKVQAHAIDTYPTTWPLLIEAIKETCDGKLHPKITLTAGSILDDFTRGLVESYFGVPVIDCYGTGETQIVAWQCRESKKYHINMDAIVVNFLKDGKPVAPGEKGKLVVTNLFSSAMPLINYDLGDIAIHSADECTCGLKLPLMDKIEGKIVECIVAPNGAIIGPFPLIEIFSGYSQLVEGFRIIQKTDRKLLAKIVKKKDYSDSTEKEILVELQKQTGPEMEIEFDYVDEIKSPGPKPKVVESKFHPKF